MGRVIPLETVRLFKPDGFPNIFRVGLTHTLFTYFRWRGARRIVGSTARVDLTRRSRERRTTIDQINTCLIGRVITALMLATWREEDRRIDGAHRSHALIAWARSTDQDQHTCAIKGVITARLEPRGGISCADRVDAWRTGDQSTRASIWSVITAEINRRGSNLSRWIEIERAKFEAFL